MKAVSLWQPWASLVAWGVKQIETRSWRPPDHLIGTGEWIAIHGTQTTPAGAWNTAWGTRQIVNALAHHGITRWEATGGPGSLPTSAIVALAQIRDVQTTDEILGTWLAHRSGTVWNYHEDIEHACGDYAPGRHGWRLHRVISLNECPIQNVGGHQRMWDVGPADELRIRATVTDLGKRLVSADPHHPIREFVRTHGTG